MPFKCQKESKCRILNIKKKPSVPESNFRADLELVLKILMKAIFHSENDLLKAKEVISWMKKRFLPKFKIRFRIGLETLYFYSDIKSRKFGLTVHRQAILARKKFCI